MERIIAIETGTRTVGIQLAELRAEIETHPCVVSAIEYARNHVPDLFIHLEGDTLLGSADLLELKREIPTLDPVLTLVLCKNEASKSSALACGCDDAVLLPVATSELVDRVRALLKRSSSRSIHGSLNDVSLFDIIQMLIAARRTGSLDVRRGPHSGHLFFHEGQVVHAESAAATGEEAFLRILRGTRGGGTFIFRSEGAAPSTRTIERRTDHLLLTLANTLDEEDAAPASK